MPSIHRTHVNTYTQGCHSIQQDYSRPIQCHQDLTSHNTQTHCTHITYSRLSVKLCDSAMHVVHLRIMHTTIVPGCTRFQQSVSQSNYLQIGLTITSNQFHLSQIGKTVISYTYIYILGITHNAYTHPESRRRG